MKNEIKIYQKHVCVDHEKMDNHLILIFTQNKRILFTCVVQYPDWFKYYDDQYEYYPICLN